MSNFIISTESTCDLSLDYTLSRKIHVIDMEYIVDGEIFGGGSGKNLPHTLFYNKMREGAKTSTSMVNEETAREHFTNLLKSGQDILHIAFAKACSGTYDNLVRVAQELNEKSQNKIYVLDSKCESTGEGLLVDLCVNKRDEGKSISETYSFLEDIRDNLNLLFTVDNLKYLAAGGRISKSTALIGNIAKIKPMLYVDVTGKLTMGGKALGRKNSLAKLASMTVEKFSGEYKKIFVSHADCIEDANFVIEKIKAKLPDTEIVLGEIGSVIGSHSGPGTIAIFFVGDVRAF